MSIDPALPKNLVEELAEMRRRIRELETFNPPVALPVPVGAFYVPLNASGYHETANTLVTPLNTGRASFSAQYLHYQVATSTSLLGGGATQNVFIGTALEDNGVITNHSLIEIVPGAYAGAIDLYAAHGESNRNKAIIVELSAQRVGGSGSAQAGYLTNCLLRVHDKAFYGG